MSPTIVSPGAGNIVSNVIDGLTGTARVVAGGPPSALTMQQAMNYPGTWIKDPRTGKLVRYNPNSGNYQIYNPATGRVRLVAASSTGLSTTTWVLIAAGGAALLYFVLRKPQRT
jgi:hypothetical protein